MTNDPIVAQSRHGYIFRPESLSHFKDVAKDIAWLLGRPLQACQSALAKIYGHGSAHQLHEVLKSPGSPGPFEARYGYLGDQDEDERTANNERRIFRELFGDSTQPLEARHLEPEKDKSFLVFELGIFLSASEQRECAKKVRRIVSEPLDYQLETINGWPLGLRGWLAKNYTETFELVESWQVKLAGEGTSGSVAWADPTLMRRCAGLERLGIMFKSLAGQVKASKPRLLHGVDFSEVQDEGGGLTDAGWEPEGFVRWVLGESDQKRAQTPWQDIDESLIAFADRPSSATAAACPLLSRLKSDPIGIRERWAFEAYRAQLAGKSVGDRFNEVAFEARMLDDTTVINGLALCDDDSDYHGSCSSTTVRSFVACMSDVVERGKNSSATTIQPVMAARCALVEPFRAREAVHGPDEPWFTVADEVNWYWLHDEAMEANSEAGDAFFEAGLRGLNMADLDDWVGRQQQNDLAFECTSILQINELAISEGSEVRLRQFFDGVMEMWDEQNMPDGYGYWARRLALSWEDRDHNETVNENGEYDIYVYRPSAAVVDVPGCGGTWVMGKGRHNEMIPWVLVENYGESSTEQGERLCEQLKQAMAYLDIDVVLYDGSQRERRREAGRDK